MPQHADGEQESGAFSPGSLRIRLLSMLTAALAPVIVLSGVSAVLDAQRSMHDRRDRLIVVAEQAVDSVEKSLEQAEILIDLFKGEVAKGKCTPVQAAVQNALPSLVNVVSYNVEGVAICSSAGDAGHPIPDKMWLAKLQFDDPIYRSNAFLGPVTQQWLFSILVRIDDDNGAFGGAVMFGLRAATLADFARRTGVPEDVDIAIADGSGRVLGSDYFDQIDTAWIEKTNADENAQMFTWKAEDGKSHDVVVQPVGESGVYAVILGRSPGLWNELTISPIISFGLPMLAYLAALLAVWLAVDRLVLHWVERLQRAARVYGAGRYRFQAGVSFADAPTEFIELARSMDEMARNISERDGELREAISVRDSAVSEIHHRVKNNLQIVTSFLSLQSRQISDPAGREALAKAQHRISALAIVHQTLYQNERLETVSLNPFLTSLINHLREALGMDESGISVTQSYVECDRKADEAIPIALFLVEAVTNAVKFAFNDKGGSISVSLSSIEDEIVLLVEDNGQGYAPGDNALKGLGSRLMEAFARQISARLEIDSALGQGCRTRLYIPGEC